MGIINKTTIIGFWVAVLLFQLNAAAQMKITHVRTVSLEVHEPHFGLPFMIGEMPGLLDGKSALIHLFEKDGKLMNAIGQRGLGPGEMMVPIHVCTANGLVVVSDFQRTGLHVFKHQKKDLRFDRFIPADGQPFASAISGNTLYVMGSWYDGAKWWWMREYDLLQRRPAPRGVISREAVQQMTNARSVKNAEKYGVLGITGACSTNKNQIFATRGDDLQVVGHDRKTGKQWAMGQSSRYFRTPDVTSQMKAAFDARDHSRMLKERQKLCVITALEATQEYVYLLFTTPMVRVGESCTILQRYSHQGEFLGEIVFSDHFPQKKKGMRQYILQTVHTGSGEKIYAMEMVEYDDDSRDHLIHEIIIK